MPKRDKHIKEYETKKGKRYKFQTYVGTDDTGKPICITRQGFETYSEAFTKYTKVRLEGIQEDYHKIERIKTDNLYELWFESYKGQVKQSTANKNLQQYKNHLKPIFGQSYMDKISVKAVQRFADKKAQEIVKYKTVLLQLSTLFEYAIRLGYAKANPVKRIIIPKNTTRPRRDIEHNVYSRTELQDFLNAAKKYNNRAYTYFKLLSSTGLRRSEALALTWKDIDFDNNTLSVNRTLAYGIGGNEIVQSPKSKKSKRTLPISSSLRDVLIEYRKTEKVIFKNVFHKYNGSYLNLSAPGNWLYKIYKANPDLKRISVHGFRHTFATLLISETNVKPKTVQMLLGHENIKMTMDVYTHLTKNNKKDAIDSIQQLDI